MNTKRSKIYGDARDKRNEKGFLSHLFYRHGENKIECRKAKDTGFLKLFVLSLFIFSIPSIPVNCPSILII